MIIAVPVSEGKLDQHFGHCRQFAIVEVDPKKREVLAPRYLDAPPHQPGLLPKWLAEHGVNLVIAGGMGQRAQELLHDNGIKVLVGALPDVPEKIVADYLMDNLQVGENCCDH